MIFLFWFLSRSSRTQTRAVWSLGDECTTNHHHHHRQCHHLQTAPALVLDELERNQKKENHLNKISKMMGTLLHLHLYTFSYRKAVIWPQNMPKTVNWGWKRSKLLYSKMAPQVQPKCFWHAKHMINNWQLEKRGYLIKFGHTEALLLKRIWH